MKIALIVPPFITVPPQRYGGTELFVAHLAEGLAAHGHRPVVYTVGDSQVGCETRWRVRHGKWPITVPLESSLDDIEHASWACADAARDCDVVHLNNAPGLNLSRFLAQPVVYTLHHPHEPALSGFYRRFPEVRFVAISRNQAAAEPMPGIDIVPHGLRLDQYSLASGRRDYLCFIGRIAPIKGTHTAIAVARRAGLPLKIAGEIQPLFRDYWDSEIRPHVDGRNVDYLGELDLPGKNELFAGARALLFPIDWEEPFGLVMIEAMACGVPVLAFRRGSTSEIVSDGISGWLCDDVPEMAARAASDLPSSVMCRDWVRDNFSVERMVQRYLDIYRRPVSARPAFALGRPAWRHGSPHDSPAPAAVGAEPAA